MEMSYSLGNDKEASIWMRFQILRHSLLARDNETLNEEVYNTFVRYFSAVAIIQLDLLSARVDIKQ
jgi:hypothetical protein